MMWPPDPEPLGWPAYGLRTPPHWAAMTDRGGPTWPEDDGIRRWRERAFGRTNRYVEDADMGANQARLGWEG